MSPEEHLDAHRAAGRMVDVGGVKTFVREEGEGPSVLLMHGVPASSFLYRKVSEQLAARGLQAVAFDLPGLGFADRPEDFDYSWSSLARWCARAVDGIGLGHLHLVVHDVGGPVGIEMAGYLRERVLSLTILNTPLDPATFRPPLVMRPFTIPAVGRAWLAGLTDTAFVALMLLQGVADTSAVSRDELLAYKVQLLSDDGGAAFLRIMQGFETTAAKSKLIRREVRAISHRQVVWGAKDPALTLRRFGRIAQEVAGVDHVLALPGKHFLQEDQAPEIAQLVSDLADRASR